MGISCGWWFLAGGHPISSWTLPVTGLTSWCCFFIGSSGQLFLFCPGICLPFTSTHWYFYPWRLILKPRLLVISFHYLANCYTCNDFFFFLIKKKIWLPCLHHGTRLFVVACGVSLVACFFCGGGSRVCGLSSSSLRASLVATCGFNCSVACSPTRDRTRVPCIGRWILNQQTTRKVPQWFL